MRYLFSLLILLVGVHFSFGQTEGNSLQIHGDIQFDAQYYRPDSLIGAPKVPEKILSNAVGNFIATYGNFTAGVRYESYLGPLQGIDPRYRGSGFPYRFVSYSDGRFTFTIGNFYEQIGSGIILRTYEDRNLGFDNSIDGVRLKMNVIKGVAVKGFVGRQRTFFDLSPAIVRGADIEISVNDLDSAFQLPGQLIIGAGAVSKFQRDEDPSLILPENVGAVSGRFNWVFPSLNIYGEYAYKANDPSLTNSFRYNRGESAFLTVSYTKKRFGLSVSGKRVDNMDFRADRNAVGNNLTINYLPALTKQHTYALAGTIYPYAIQPLGEMSGQIELTYNLPKGSALGGKYGTSILVNLSGVNNIQRNALNDDSTNRIGYESPFFGVGKQKYFRDYNIEISRKLSDKVKASVTYLHLVYNKDVVQGLSGFGTIEADIAIADLTWKVNKKHILRFEGQTLQTKQDLGSWAMGLLEYSFGSKFYAAIIDQYNYGNSIADQQIHYITGNFGVNLNTTNIRCSFGRQRAGIVCVGGVCRNVPASNGVQLSVTSSF
jgi:hypothetical protein